MDSTIVFNTVASTSSSCVQENNLQVFTHLSLVSQLFPCKNRNVRRHRIGSLPQNHRARPELDEDAFQTLDLKITEVHGIWRIVVKTIWHFKNLEVVPKHARFHWRFLDRWTLFQNSFGFPSFYLHFREFKGLCFADSWNLLQDAGRSVYFQLVCVPFVYKSGSVSFLLLLIFKSCIKIYQVHLSNKLAHSLLIFFHQIAIQIFSFPIFH